MLSEMSGSSRSKSNLGEGGSLATPVTLMLLMLMGLIMGLNPGLVGEGDKEVLGEIGCCKASSSRNNFNRFDALLTGHGSGEESLWPLLPLDGSNRAAPEAPSSSAAMVLSLGLCISLTNWDAKSYREWEKVNGLKNRRAKMAGNGNNFLPQCFEYLVQNKKHHPALLGTATMHSKIQRLMIDCWKGYNTYNNIIHIYIYKL